MSSIVLARFGARRGMLAMMLLFGAGIAVIGLGTDVARSVPVVLVGLVMWGFGNGCLDVMMNVEGAAIEEQSGKTILPLFHAFFSFGTVIGAGLGVVFIGAGFTVLAHLAIVAGLIAVIAIVSIANVPAREFTQDAPAAAGPGWRARLAESLSAWREPRTYALGVVMLGMAFAEGGANDWLALGIVEGHTSPEELGALGLAVFSVSMAVVRVFGGPLVDRFGRVAVLRVLSITATAELLLFILAPSTPLVFVGAALWGIGASLGFPLGMSAAGDDPARAAARVSATRSGWSAKCASAQHPDRMPLPDAAASGDFSASRHRAALLWQQSRGSTPTRTARQYSRIAARADRSREGWGRLWRRLVTPFFGRPL